MKLRVVQWTTGKTGGAAVRGMVGHPALDLVGCYAYSPEKVGEDVGVLAGIEPIGINATDDVDASTCVEARLRELHAVPTRLRPCRPHPRVGRQPREHDVHARRERLRRRRPRAHRRRCRTRPVVALCERHLPGSRQHGGARGERDVHAYRLHLCARVARHERVRERADVPRDGHRPGDRRPGSARARRSRVRIVQGADPGDGAARSSWSSTRFASRPSSAPPIAPPTSVS